jgi:hypothetical protein
MRVTNNGDPKWFLKAARNRAITAEEDKLVSEIAQTIGERRYRELLDLIAGIEQTRDWSSAMSILSDALSCSYLTPFTFERKNRKLEPLKCREVIFELFSCSGLEPIPEDTPGLLQNLQDKESFARASVAFEDYVLSQAIEEIHTGSTLFFEFPPNLSFSEKHKTLLEDKRKQEIECLQLSSNNNEIKIGPLWNTSYGKNALSELGVKGFSISYDEFDQVLSVLQVTQSTKEQIRRNFESTEKAQSSCTEKQLSNPEYSTLLNSLIEQDTSTIRSQGSKHAVPTLNVLLLQSLSRYQSSESSDDYRMIVERLTDLTLIRSIDSLCTYEALTQLRDLRITTQAISALGNYFHDSAVAILIDLVCTSREQWIMQASLNALRNQTMKYPEAQFSIKEAIDSGCRNSGLLKRLIRKHDA